MNRFYIFSYYTVCLHKNRELTFLDFNFQGNKYIDLYHILSYFSDKQYNTIIMNLISTKTSAAISFSEYYSIIENLLAEGKTSGTNHSEAMVHYTALNMQRMNRLLKTIEIEEELAALVKNSSRNLCFLVLAEAWCGDVAQNLPIMHKIIELNPNWQMQIVWRDENLDLMNAYLTNGTISIPKVIVYDPSNFQELAVWGPRPEILQQKVLEYKSDQKGIPYAEFVESVHLWYAKDKGKALQAEWMELLEKVFEG